MRWRLWIAAIAILAGSMVGTAQEAILDLSIEPTSLTLTPGGESVLWVVAENRSIREADELTAYWIEPEGVGFAEDPQAIKVIDPFGSATLGLRIAADSDIDMGERTGHLEVVYTYCIDDSCYQIVEPFDVVVRVVEPTEDAVQTPAAVAPPPTHAGPTGSASWRLVVFGVALLGLALAFLIWRATGARWPAYAMIVVILAGGLGIGVFLDQHNQAQAIGAVLCTSCVGLEESRHDEAGFTSEQIERLGSLEQDVDLIVFYAVWCHSCPYAEALAERAAEATNRISVRFADVEAERSLAEQHGVIRSGRTVVPAILRVDTGEVIFGVEGLEERLLTLLGVGQ